MRSLVVPLNQAQLSREAQVKLYKALTTAPNQHRTAIMSIWIHAGVPDHSIAHLTNLLQLSM
jgi:hypothetical protein